MRNGSWLWETVETCVDHGEGRVGHSEGINWAT
jgi:hypothetical protein